MLRPSLVAVASLSLFACHVSIGPTSPPPSTAPSSAAKKAAAPQAKPAPARSERSAKAPTKSTTARKSGNKKRKKAANDTVAKNDAAVRANPKNDAAVRTNPKKKGARANPKKKGARANPKKEGARANPKGKGKSMRVNPVTPPPAAASGINVVCDFEQGWVAVLPADLYDPGEEFLMQALIGLSGDPGFWGGLNQYAKYEPYKAQECSEGGVQFDLPPGSYVVAVGMANQFTVRGEYRDNGYLEELELQAGAGHKVRLGESELVHTWLCISCPYLVVFQNGKAVEAGQVLKDRYTRRRYGTDVVRTQADVVDGVLTLRLDEREPETSFIDAVVVRVKGRVLKPLNSAPKGLRAIDDDTTALKLGDSAVLEFDAGRLEDGLVDVEVEVSGHYEPIGPLL